jgi:transposase
MTLRLPRFDGQALGQDKGPTVTKNKPAGAPRRHFDATFKDEAVGLWQTSGRAAEEVARDLGISVFSLYEWKRMQASSRAAGSTRASASKEQLVAEVEHLRKELARVTEQRDILKKAAGILSEPSPSGMPGSKR